MILLSGENSSIASYLLPHLRNSQQVCSFGPDKGDINSDSFLQNIFHDIAPTIFINLDQVDESDNAEIYREWAYNSNSFAPQKIAKICKEHNIFFIHISTTEVYPSEQSILHKEDSILSPDTVFSDSKLLGEQFIVESGCKHLILRIPKVFGRNDRFLTPFLEKALRNERIQILRDQTFMPLFASDVASVISQVIDNNVAGVYNCAGNDVVTMYQFLFQAFDLLNSVKSYNLSPQVEELDYDYFHTHADQLLYNKIDSSAINAATGFSPASCEEGLHSFIKEFANG
ncbi:MAG: sugar nucleotide-binding protein [Spirochaetes bacterium]|jgi:dTDP-4-dehydrorhamnose reductase|nr:sugar nucleotide-binding protein [Spirochaetota bacterium]